MFKRKRAESAEPQPIAPAPRVVWDPQPLPVAEVRPAWRDVWAGERETDRAWR